MERFILNLMMMNKIIFIKGRVIALCARCDNERGELRSLHQVSLLLSITKKGSSLSSSTFFDDSFLV